MKNPKQWWTEQRAVASQRKAELSALKQALMTSDNPAALRRAVAYVARYGWLTESQFEVACSRDTVINSAALGKALATEALAKGLIESVDFKTRAGAPGYRLTAEAHRNRGLFIVSSRNIITPDILKAGYLESSPGRTVSPGWNAERDFGK